MFVEDNQVEKLSEKIVNHKPLSNPGAVYSSLSFCFMNLDFCTPPAYVTAHETNNEGMKGRGKDDGGYNSNER